MVFSLFYPYLSSEHISGFDNYKYSSKDTSPVAVYISHPFWNYVVKFVPNYIAPNVLTFAGFVLVMSSFVLLSFLDYYIVASSGADPHAAAIPNSVWLVLGIFNLAAHILDGIDGKQARKIGASGPTGELFDHGIDSWLTVPFIICSFAVFGRDGNSVPALYLLLTLIAVQAVFIVTHWEKYNTGVLFLSWGYDIGQYLLTFFYLWTYFMGGNEYWWSVRDPFFQFSAALMGVVSCLFFSFAVSVPMSLYNIYKSYRGGTAKQNSFYEAVRPLVSSGLLFTVALIWGLSSPSDVLNEDPRAFMWAMGTIFSNIACRLIISQMSQTRCELFNSLLIPYIGAAVVFLNWPSVSVFELHCLYLIVALATIAHVHYAVCVVRQMCDHFNIRCFVVARRKGE